MRQLTLLAIPDCPLSAHARQVLDALAADGLLAWHEVSTGTPNGEALQRNQAKHGTVYNTLAESRVISGSGHRRRPERRAGMRLSTIRQPPLM
jgi:hypothetical protein